MVPSLQPPARAMHNRCGDCLHNESSHQKFRSAAAEKHHSSVLLQPSSRSGITGRSRESFFYPASSVTGLFTKPGIVPDCEPCSCKHIRDHDGRDTHRQLNCLYLNQLVRFFTPDRFAARSWPRSPAPCEWVTQCSNQDHLIKTQPPLPKYGIYSVPERQKQNSTNHAGMVDPQDCDRQYAREL